MVDLFANSEDSDKTPHSVVSDLGLHCLSVALLGVSRLQWVKPHTEKRWSLSFCKHITEVPKK